MHALITGAGGFVGAHIARALTAAGWTVTGVVRSDRPDLSDIPLVKTDLRDPKGLPAHYDMLVHCAAEVPARSHDPEALFERNVATTRAVLAHAATAGATRAVNMSTVSVYGPIDGGTVNETTPPLAIDAYGRSKIACEALFAEWAAGQPGRGAVSIRLPGVVGPGSRDNFLSGALATLGAGKAIAAGNPDALFNSVLHIRELTAFVAHLGQTLPAGHAALTIAAAEPIRVAHMLELLATNAGVPLLVDWREGKTRPYLITYDAARALGFQAATVADSIARFGATSAAR